MITSFITGVITHSNNKYVNIHKEKLWVTNRYTRPVQKFRQKARCIGVSEYFGSLILPLVRILLIPDLILNVTPLMSMIITTITAIKNKSNITFLFLIYL